MVEGPMSSKNRRPEAPPKGAAALPVNGMPSTMLKAPNWILRVTFSECVEWFGGPSVPKEEVLICSDISVECPFTPNAPAYVEEPGKRGSSGPPSNPPAALESMADALSALIMFSISSTSLKSTWESIASFLKGLPVADSSAGLVVTGRYPPFSTFDVVYERGNPVLLIKMNC